MKTKTRPQKLTALPPAHPLGARFCQYFSHPWKHIYKPLAAPGEKTQWIAAKYFLELRTLWERYLDPNTIIGLRFGSSTRYCLLDVDRGSCYHPANDEAAFKSVLAALEEIGLCRPLVVRSSNSDGLHIYYFLDRPLPTFGLACALWFALNDAGLRVRSGQLETFPNMKAWGSLYNGCRLPLQAGSYLLDDDLEILTNDLTQFLDAADVAAAHQDLPAIKEAIAAAEKRPRRRSTNRLPEDDAQWKAEWEKIIAQGWTGAGQTNELLKIMVAYGTVFQGLKGKELVDYVEATAITAPGYREYCGHQHEIRQRAQHWVSSTEHNEFYVKYCAYPNRRGNYQQTYGVEAINNVVSLKNQQLNSERSQEAQSRLEQARALLEAAGALPKAIVARAKAIIAKAKEVFNSSISHQTLWKHLSLWHPKYYNPNSVLQKESLLDEDNSNIPTPPLCSTQNNQNSELLKPLPAKDKSDNSHTPPLMKVCDEDFPPAVQQQQHLSLSGCSSGRDPSADDCHTNRHSAAPLDQSQDTPVAATAPAAPVALEALQAALKAFDFSSAITGQSPQVVRCLTTVWLNANAHAKKAVRIQQMDESCKFDTVERERREIIAKIQFFYRSSEQLVRKMVAAMLLDNPQLIDLILNDV